MKKIMSFAVFLASLTAGISGSALASEPGYLFLKANGVDVPGEPSQISLGRQNSIECFDIQYSVKAVRDAGTGMPTGRRQWEPLRCVKKIDKSSPLILKALVQNQVVSGVMKFFRPNPTGDGSTQLYLIISFDKARIQSVKGASQSLQSSTLAKEPMLEEVEIVFGSITVSAVQSGIEFQDNIGGRE